ncbi:MAG: transcription antitermination factor NusB [Desulfovibrio sp.]|jgi:N utilization substance protein B|nr:transcription antitermination factor NusB [Desulfovibrio sp.]
MSRRLERIFAFKVLYGLCFSPAESEEEVLRSYLLAPERPEGLGTGPEETFAWRLIHGVWKHQAALDERIGDLSRNWRPDRMGRVELTLLRLALFELLFHRDTPPKVVINEAVEISKQFGDELSRGFVNGIMDSAAKTLEKSDPERPEHEISTRDY